MPRLTAGAALLLTGAALGGCGNGGGGPDVLDGDGNAFVAVDSLGADQLAGSWSSAGGRCAEPDFTIAEDDQAGRRGLAVRAEFNGWTRTGRLRAPAGGQNVADGASIRFVDPERILPAALQDGGLHIDAPADGLAVLGSRNIFAGGVTFRKCAGGPA